MISIDNKILFNISWGGGYGMSKYNITKDTLALIGKNRNMVHIIETKHSYHIEDKIINRL